MLAEIRAYLQERGQAPLADIARHLDVTPELAREMLELWIRKGKVQRMVVTASCGTRCSQCDPATTEIYAWGKAAPPDTFLQQKCSLS